MMSKTSFMKNSKSVYSIFIVVPFEGLELSVAHIVDEERGGGGRGVRVRESSTGRSSLTEMM
jgi:hypothetical protein